MTDIESWRELLREKMAKAELPPATAETARIVELAEGKAIIISLQPYGNEDDDGIDIRVWYNRKSYQGPTGKGIRLPLDAVEALPNAINEFLADHRTHAPASAAKAADSRSSVPKQGAHRRSRSSSKAS